MSKKKHTLVFEERSVDWPPEVFKRWGGEMLVLPDGRLAVRWPVVYVETVDGVPPECPCPMGVPIMAFGRGVGTPGSDFEVFGLVDQGRVNGELKFKRIIIRNMALRERLLGGAAKEAAR